MARLCIQIGALVVDCGFSKIFDYAIISAFMFIFCFLYYISYKIFEYYLKDRNETDFLEGLLKVAPIIFGFIGFIFLFLIAYEFGTSQSPDPNTTLKESRPILNFILVFHISYYISYITYGNVKYLRHKSHTEKFRSKILIGSLAALTAFIPVLIQQLSIIFNIIININTYSITIIPIMIYGMTVFLSQLQTIFRVKRNLYKSIMYFIAALIIIVIIMNQIELLLKANNIIAKNMNFLNFLYETIESLLNEIFNALMKH